MSLSPPPFELILNRLCCVAACVVILRGDKEVGGALLLHPELTVSGGGMPVSGGRGRRVPGRLAEAKYAG